MIQNLIGVEVYFLSDTERSYSDKIREEKLGGAIGGGCLRQR